MKKKKSLRPKADEMVDVSIWVPCVLIADVKQAAANAGLTYQRFVRQTLESAVQPRGKA